MISKDFFKALEVLADERQVDKEKILEIFGRGLINAYKKAYDGKTNVEVVFNEEKAEIILVCLASSMEICEPSSASGLISSETENSTRFNSPSSSSMDN